jgi:fructokinase
MNDKSEAIYGGIEAGGTKFVCITGTGPEDIRASAHFATTTPEETLKQVTGFFRKQSEDNALTAIGAGSFGPLDLNPASPTYGSITTTPKTGWAGTNLTGILERELGIPVFTDTDVNAAALAERTWGAARNLDTFLYLTIGTGIGGGGMANDELLHGLGHPEMGHIYIPHDRGKDPFEGTCPYHGDCLEGLASGEAMRQRWGQTADRLPPEHPGWEMEAGYLADGIINYIYILSPQRVIAGGGVMKQPRLLPMLRSMVRERINGYTGAAALNENIDEYIVMPELGDMAGVLGALRLAEMRQES